MDGETEVKLMAFKELCQHRMDDMKALMDEKFSATQKALELQATEYDRRLHDLNNEATRIRKIREETVSMELWRAQHERLEADIAELKDFKSRMEGKASQTSVLVAYAFSAVGIILAILGVLHI